MTATQFAKTADLVSIGSIVSYQDAANPSKDYVVVSIDRTDQWSPFTLRSVDPQDGYAYTSTDMRQTGWTLVSS